LCGSHSFYQERPFVNNSTHKYLVYITAQGTIPNFGNLHNRRRRLKAFEAAWSRQQDQEPGWPHNEIDRRFQAQLDEWLRFHHAMLVGELIPVTLAYLRGNPGCRELNLFDHVLVDEYQDLNRAEQALIDLLSSRESLAIVGDEDQSIYESFRYAHPEGISRFHESHEGTVDIPLERSRRCPTRIVSIANSLIQNNLRRTGRILQPLPGNIEGEIHVVQWPSMESEAEGIASYITSKIDLNEFDPGQTLVLCPRRQFGYLIRDVLRDRGYPAYSFFHEEVLEGHPKRLDDCRAQEAFTLLNLIANPDDRVSLRCWLGFGSPSLKATEYQRLRDHCSSNHCSPREALEVIVRGETSIRYTSGIISRYRELQSRLETASRCSLDKLVDFLFPSDEEWAEPFRLIINENPDDQNTSEILDSIRTSIIQPELPRNVDFIRIMSLHKSKGLNADHVIVCGCIEGLIPSRDSTLPFEEERRHLEEQRRLFYVAITRARRTLVLSSVLSLPRKLAHRMRAEVHGGDDYYGETIASPFILELGPDCPRAVLGDEWEY
jgi:superfamily I DNA/RNA helicase